MKESSLPIDRVKPQNPRSPQDAAASPYLAAAFADQLQRTVGRADAGTLADHGRGPRYVKLTRKVVRYLRIDADQQRRRGGSIGDYHRTLGRMPCTACTHGYPLGRLERPRHPPGVLVRGDDRTQGPAFAKRRRDPGDGAGTEGAARGPLGARREGRDQRRRRCVRAAETEGAEEGWHVSEAGAARP